MANINDFFVNVPVDMLVPRRHTIFAFSFYLNHTKFRGAPYLVTGISPLILVPNTFELRTPRFSESI